MPGATCDGQHFIAERGDQEQIDFGKDAGHFLGNTTSKTVGLYQIHCRQEAGLAKDVWPGIRDLNLKFAQATL